MSRFEIYSFRQTGLIQDQYKLKNPELSASTVDGGASRQSVIEVLASPNNMARKNTLFSSIPETINLQDSYSLANRNLEMEKLLATEDHPYKIQYMTYFQETDMLSVGLSNGQIVNYTLEIESFVYTGDQQMDKKI